MYVDRSVLIIEKQFLNIQQYNTLHTLMKEWKNCLHECGERSF